MLLNHKAFPVQSNQKVKFTVCTPWLMSQFFQMLDGGPPLVDGGLCLMLLRIAIFRTHDKKNPWLIVFVIIVNATHTLAVFKWFSRLAFGRVHTILRQAGPD